MQIVSAREFRANQTAILRAAKDGQSVMLTSRVGNFKIVPVTSEDSIVDRDIRSAIAEVVAHMEGKKALPLAKDVIF